MLNLMYYCCRFKEYFCMNLNIYLNSLLYILPNLTEYAHDNCVIDVSFEHTGLTI
jgi:hypothetical protein